jgi:carbon-monoxide dehydrogenase medium subunit
MVPETFNYVKADSVRHAVSLLEEYGDEARILSGGHSLLPAMKLRLSDPGILIDIRGLDEISGINELSDSISIGAGTTHSEIAHSEYLASNLPVLCKTASRIGDPQVRNMGTIGGNIAHADPASDWPAVILALNATIVTQGANGSRSIAASDFFTGLFETALGESEMITHIHIPKEDSNTRSSYHKFAQPASRYALVGCAVQATAENNVIKDARVAFNGVASSAFRDKQVETFLIGKPVSTQNIADAAKLAADNMDLLSDHFASPDYRKHLAVVFANRALESVLVN